MFEVIIYVGIFISILGGVFFLIEAFKESVIWGLACLLITPVSLVFIFLHWDVSKRPVLIQLAGAGVMFLGVLISSLF
jgi:uncharacterized membrane protein